MLHDLLLYDHVTELCLEDNPFKSQGFKYIAIFISHASSTMIIIHTSCLLLTFFFLVPCHQEAWYLPLYHWQERNALSLTWHTYFTIIGVFAHGSLLIEAFLDWDTGWWSSSISIATPLVDSTQSYHAKRSTMVGCHASQRRANWSLLAIPSLCTSWYSDSRLDRKWITRRHHLTRSSSCWKQDADSFDTSTVPDPCWRLHYFGRCFGKSWSWGWGWAHINHHRQ